MASSASRTDCFALSDERKAFSRLIHGLDYGGCLDVANSPFSLSVVEWFCGCDYVACGVPRVGTF